MSPTVNLDDRFNNGRLDLSQITEADTLVKGIARFNGQIEILDLNHSAVTSVVVKEIAKLKGLKELDLSYTKVTSVMLMTLARTKSLFSVLKKLNLGHTETRDGGPLAIALSENSLSALYLNSTKVIDLGMVEVAKLKGLWLLDLSYTTVADVGLIQLWSLNELKLLGLNSTMVTDDGLKDIPNLQAITELGLSHTAVTNAGVANILPQLKKLEALDLSGTQVTRGALKQPLTGRNIRVFPHNCKNRSKYFEP